MDIEQIEQIIAAIVAVVGYVIAWLKTREVQSVQDFFDPESTVVTAPKGTPTRSYYMSEPVKQFILNDAEPGEEGEISRQILDAEAKMDATGKMIPYVITFRSGRWYIIEYGQIAGGGSPGTPPPTI